MMRLKCWNHRRGFGSGLFFRLSSFIPYPSSLVSCLLVLFLCAPAGSQERRKIRISNANFSFTALPLVAARDWKLFTEQGLDVEIILMRSSAAAAALASGDLDYQSGIGPATVGASLSGLESRAVWSSTNKIAYWLMARSEERRVGKECRL